MKFWKIPFILLESIGVFVGISSHSFFLKRIQNLDRLKTQVGIKSRRLLNDSRSISYRRERRKMEREMYYSDSLREKCIIQTHWRPIAFKENAKEMHRMHKDSLNFCACFIFWFTQTLDEILKFMPVKKLPEYRECPDLMGAANAYIRKQKWKMKLLMCVFFSGVCSGQLSRITLMVDRLRSCVGLYFFYFIFSYFC